MPEDIIKSRIPCYIQLSRCNENYAAFLWATYQLTGWYGTKTPVPLLPFRLYSSVIDHPFNTLKHLARTQEMPEAWYLLHNLCRIMDKEKIKIWWSADEATIGYTTSTDETARYCPEELKEIWNERKAYLDQIINTYQELATKKSTT